MFTAKDKGKSVHLINEKSLKKLKKKYKDLEVIEE